MARLSLLLVACLGVTANALVLKAKVPLTEKVFVGGTQVWGKDISDNEGCVFPMTYSDPSIKVCGKFTKVEFFMLSNCQQDPGSHFHSMGPAGANTCAVASTAEFPWMAHMQSYKVTFDAGAR
jgi:hypothetical protein